MITIFGIKLLAVVIAILVLGEISARKRQKRTTTTTTTTTPPPDYEEDYSDDEYDDYEDDEENINIKFKGTLREDFVMRIVMIAPKTNLVCSPLNAVLSLAQIVLGAENNSYAHNEIYKAIGLENETQAQFEKIFQKYTSALTEIPIGAFGLLNRLFYAKWTNVTELDEDFRNESEKIFGHSGQVIPYDNPIATASIMNMMMATLSDNKISYTINSDRLVDVSVVAISSAYLTGNQWKYSFKKVQKPVKFLTHKGNKECTMMSTMGEFANGNSNALNAKIVKIPYVKDNATLIIISPYKTKKFKQLLETIYDDVKIINEELNTLNYSDMVIVMPMFRIVTLLNLGPLYKKLDIGTIFSRRSGLKKIVADNETFISAAAHGTTFEVDDGADKYASMFSMDEDSGGGDDQAHLKAPFEVPKHITWIINKPFLFFVTWRGEQLFGGIYNGPE